MTSSKILTTYNSYHQQWWWELCSQSAINTIYKTFEGKNNINIKISTQQKQCNFVGFCHKFYLISGQLSNSEQSYQDLSQD